MVKLTLGIILTLPIEAKSYVDVAETSDFWFNRELIFVSVDLSENWLGPKLEFMPEDGRLQVTLDWPAVTFNQIIPIHNHHYHPSLLSDINSLSFPQKIFCKLWSLLGKAAKPPVTESVR